VSTGDNLTAAKAVWGTVAGALAPGAAYLIASSGDGVSGSEWLVAGLLVITGGAAVGATVYGVENKAKVPPVDEDPPPRFG
jgi:hypothetical protein